jgi:hypothetical protein
MSELEMKTDVEIVEFADELSDEALDRADGEAGYASNSCQSCAAGTVSFTPRAG